MARYSIEPGKSFVYPGLVSKAKYPKRLGQLVGARVWSISSRGNHYGRLWLTKMLFRGA